MGSGPEHSAPLKVKYHRLQQFTQPVILKAPTQTTRRAVSEKFLVNKHSCVITKKKKKIGQRYQLYLKVVINQNEVFDLHASVDPDTNQVG